MNPVADNAADSCLTWPVGALHAHPQQGEAMNQAQAVPLAWLLAAALLGVIAPGARARAGSLQEDEARIEALLRAERNAQRTAERNARAASAAVPASGQESLDPATPVIAEVTAAVPEPSENDAWLVPTIEQDGLPFTDLKHYVGHRVEILTTGDRQHRGTVKSADARQVTLLVRRPGGNATYTLRREQVKRVDPR